MLRRSWLENVKIRQYPLHYADGWHIDIAALKAKVDNRTRAIVLISPNNPTGSFVTKHDAQEIAKLGIPLIVDEVFTDYAIDNVAHTNRAISDDYGDTLCFRLDGLSKTLALPQAKLGWIWMQGKSRAVAKQKLEHINDTFLSAQTSIQQALPAILAEHSVIQQTIIKRLKNNLIAAKQACHGTPITPLHVEGGWSMIIRLPNSHDDEAWALAMLTANFIVHPGYFYDLPGSHIIMSLLTPEKALTAALGQLVYLSKQ